MNKYMKIAKENADKGIANKEGGPFGAVIVNKEGNIIANGNNKVLINKDPTAHAEIVAIREACKALNTNDLSKCILYTSCEPCPMCLSAIIWANIKEVYFRDNDIYEFIKGNNNMINLKQIDRDECIKTMQKYQKDEGTIY